MITDPATIAKIATLNAQIAALNDALNSGVTRVSYDGRSVEYRSMQELKMTLNRAMVEVNQLMNPAYRKPTAGVARFVRPWHAGFNRFGRF